MNEEPQSKTLCSVDARVVCSTPICRQHTVIEFTVPDFPASEPGQFLQLLCGPAEQTQCDVVTWPADGFPSLSDQDSAGRRAFLRRPFSIADRWRAPDGAVHLCVISRNVGPGTTWLEGLRAGQTLNVSGPLGRGFRIPDAETRLVLIGGGIGIPPLLYLTRRLHELGRRQVTVICGATTRDLLPLRLIEEPAADGTPRVCAQYPAGAPYPTVITSDDGSVGLRGGVTDALRAWHSRRLESGQSSLVLACGPDGMLKAVAQLTRELRMDCQLCIERRMACGMGACLSCVVRARDQTRPEGWRWVPTCRDGPVFERDELLDYAADAGA